MLNINASMLQYVFSDHQHTTCGSVTAVRASHVLPDIYKKLKMTKMFSDHQRMAYTIERDKRIMLLKAPI